MKEIIFFSFLIPVFFAPHDVFSKTVSVHFDKEMHQMLCATERDPVMRKNHCDLFQKNAKPDYLFHDLRKDIAVL